MNALLQPWSGPFGGVPPLDRVRVEDFEGALTAGMTEKRAEAKAIRDDPSPPTFANTMERLEQMGGLLDRVESVYHLWSNNFSTPEFREVKRRMEPQLTELRDQIRQDGALYARVQTVSETAELDAEQRRLVDRWLVDFKKAGAQLDAAGRARVAAINVRLSVLFTAFSDALLADEEEQVTFIDAHQLGGLPASFVAAAAKAAKDAGQPGRYAVLNTRSSMEPFLTYSDERALREVVWRKYFSRGGTGGDNDTKAGITEILALRAERAALLGFETHAHLQLATTMAGSPEAAMGLMKRVWEPAREAFRREVAAMQALVGDAFEIDRWDVRYYAEKLRGTAYDFDPSELSEYYQLDKLVEGMFWTATERFGWRFEPADVPLPHEDFSAWWVRDADGEPIGVFYLDPYARKGKRSGAWMTAYRVQSGLLGHLPVISNNCNYQRPPEGEPCLLTQDEAETLFHEFGHGLHGLASKVRYTKLAGTSVPRDYVEFPSQLNEHWLTTTELLERFALHRSTGAPPPTALLEKRSAASNSDSGFRTMEFLASAVMDMEMHLHEGSVDPAAFEDEVLGRWGLPREVVMRHRTTQFAHVFSDDYYSAGYYCYLWADVLVADAAEAFAAKSFYDPALSRSLMDLVLSRGNTIPPTEAFRTFRGRDPEVEALLRDRGL